MTTKVHSLPSITYERALDNAPKECSICFEELSLHPYLDDPFYIKCHGADHDVAFHITIVKSKGENGKEEDKKIYHAAHERCFSRWAMRQPSCPVCREELDFSSLSRKGISLRYHLYLTGKEVCEELSENLKTVEKTCIYVWDKTTSIMSKLFHVTRHLEEGIRQRVQNNPPHWLFSSL